MDHTSEPPSKWQAVMSVTPPHLVLKFIILANILLLIVQLSTPIDREIDLIHCDVTVGKVNGSLHLGPYGYCLYLPNNKTCVTAKPQLVPYKIDTTQVQFQNPYPFISIIDYFPAFNLITIFFAIITLIFTIWSLNASNPNWSDGTRVVARFFAGVGAAIPALGAMVVESLFIGNACAGNLINNAGGGFWLTLCATLILLVFAVFAGYLQQIGEQQQRSTSAAKGSNNIRKSGKI